LGTALLSTAAFIVLSFCVAAGMTQGVDDAVRRFFRPNDVWGVYQRIFEHFVDALAPPVTISILLVAGGVSAWRLRSIRPMVFAGLSVGLAATLTILTKATLHRPDPHGGASWLGGAYPSGHVLMLLISLGCALLVLRAATWWLWTGVALVALTLAVSLLLEATHWLTDIVGGALLGITLLAMLHNARNCAFATEEKCRVVPAQRDLGA
jgi:membrane-associated phospholipid phosphatase